MTLKILGVQGFRFGDTILTSMLPPKYKDKIGNARICFTVLKVKHTFGESWETELETQCRIVMDRMVKNDPSNELDSSIENYVNSPIFQEFDAKDNIG